MEVIMNNFDDSQKFPENDDTFSNEQINTSSIDDLDYDQEMYDTIEEDIEAKKFELKPLLWKLFVAFVGYALLMHIVAAFFSSNISLDYGIAMILGTGLPLLLVITMLRKVPLGDIFSFHKQSAGISDFIYFMGLMLLGNIIFSYLANYITDYFNFRVTDVMEIIGNANSIPMFIYVVLIGPIIEEILYRGYLLRNLSRFSKNAALIIATLVFAFMHLNLVQSVSVLGMSFVLCYVGMHYSFKFACILHLANNLQAMILTMIIESFGEESISVMIYSLLLIVIVIYAIFRFLRRGRKSLAHNLKSSESEKYFTKRIVFSIPMILLVLFYISLTLAVIIYLPKIS